MVNYTTDKNQVGYMTKLYKFVTYEDWETKYKTHYPNARVNIEKTEVLLSCKGEGLLTFDEAHFHINNVWTQLPTPEYVPEPYVVGSELL